MSKQRPAFSRLTYHSKRPRRPGAIRFDVRAIFFFAVVIALIGSAGWLYLAQASRVAGYAHRIRELQREKEQLHYETIVLRSRVAELGSLGRIMELGQTLGYDLPPATDQQRRLRIDLLLPSEPPDQVEPELTTSDVRAESQGLWQGTVHWVNELIQQFQTWLDSGPTER